MLMTHLHIYQDYTSKKYNCSVTFKGENGTTELKLLPETSEAILNVVADQIVAAAKDTANKLTREVIENSILSLGSDNE